MIMIGESAGLILRYAGLLRQIRRQLAPRRVDRRLHIPRRAIHVAAQIKLQHDPDHAQYEEYDVISLTPAIFANCRSSGVATAEAIVSGSAPGRSRAHRDHRILDLRQTRHRQQRISHRIPPESPRSTAEMSRPAAE